MNLPLDELIRSFLRGEQLGDGNVAGSNTDVHLRPSDSTDIAAILGGDLRYLHDRGSHPLLIMQLAGVLGIDAATRLNEAASANSPIEDGTSIVC